MKSLEKDTLVEIIRLKEQEGLSQAKIAEIVGTSQPVIHYFLSRRTYGDFWEEHDQAPLASGTTTPPMEKVLKYGKGPKVYVITSAQANTFRHAKGFDSLMRYVESRDAELLVSTYDYNKRKSSQDIWYDPVVRPYINNNNIELAKGLIYCGSLDVSPTAANPTTRLKGYMGANSIIVPSAKLICTPVATPDGVDAKHIHTTATITQYNYIQRLTGQVAEHHHVFGALVVEIDEKGLFWVRELCIETDTGNFYDFDRYYTPEGYTEGHRVLALSYWDIHAKKRNEAVAQAGWVAKDSLLADTDPLNVFLDDIHDHEPRNHHIIKDPYVRFKTWSTRDECVRDEISLSTTIFREILKTSKGRTKIHVKDSNHDRALEGWLKTADYREDPVNAVFFLELQTINYKQMAAGEHQHTFTNACMLVDKEVSQHVKFLDPDKLFTMAGVACNFHGDKGANGARGSVQGFAKVGHKIQMNHIHTRNIFEGVWSSGAGMLPEDTDYCSGPSSWSVTATLIHANGKRQGVTMKKTSKGKYKHRA